MSKNEYEIKSASFEMNLDNGLLNVKRKITFKEAHVEFDIAIPYQGQTDTLTLEEIHRQSVTGVINRLQSLLTQEK